MERLNLRTPKIFDYTDEAETINRRIHFYCISEGATEESYFYGVRNNKTELNIKNDVYIEVIEKQEGQETLSHPMQLVKACLFQMGRIDLEGNSISKDKWVENCKWDNFELWLLMHFPDIKQYAPEMLLERFLPLVDTATRQAKAYCEEPKKIINELGTSVGRLIEEMKK
ncbi:MAG: RloB domain-containing protein [Lachnospiraceae bacterium]|nr:RloB domain-containing protein [Lachnospiraceae bacterium]